MCHQEGIMIFRSTVGIFFQFIEFEFLQDKRLCSKDYPVHYSLKTSGLQSSSKKKKKKRLNIINFNVGTAVLARFAKEQVKE